MNVPLQNWQEAYCRNHVEEDGTNLAQRVLATESAILALLQELKSSSDHDRERAEIQKGVIPSGRKTWPFRAGMRPPSAVSVVARCTLLECGLLEPAESNC
jgi:hypothetical protein